MFFCVAFSYEAFSCLAWVVRDVEDRKPGAFERLLDQARSGDFEAQMSAGNFLEQGKWVEKNIDDAIYWYKRAANLGYPYAKEKLSNLYLHGMGVPKNITEGLYWHMLLNPDETELMEEFTNLPLEQQADIVRKARQWKPEVYSGSDAYIGAQSAIFHSDNERLLESWLPAAQAGNEEAQRNLCDYYTEGFILPKNIQAGHKWCVASAKNGNLYSLFDLGTIEELAALEKKSRLVKGARRHILNPAAVGSNDWQMPMTPSEKSQVSRILDTCLSLKGMDLNEVSQNQSAPEVFLDIVSVDYLLKNALFLNRKKVSVKGYVAESSHYSRARCSDSRRLILTDIPVSTIMDCLENPASRERSKPMAVRFLVAKEDMSSYIAGTEVVVTGIMQVSAGTIGLRADLLPMYPDKLPPWFP